MRRVLRACLCAASLASQAAFPLHAAAGDSGGGFRLFRLEGGLASNFLMVLARGELYPAPGLNLGAALFFNSAAGARLWSTQVFPLASDSDIAFISDVTVGPTLALKAGRFTFPLSVGFYFGVVTAQGGSGAPQAMNFGPGAAAGLEFAVSDTFYAYGRVQASYGVMGGGDLSIVPALGVGLALGKSRPPAPPPESDPSPPEGQTPPADPLLSKKIRFSTREIVFAGFRSDFEMLDSASRSRNERILSQLADMFINRFPEYRITVEGHANPVLWTAKEEREMLKPISTARAHYILERLVSLGVSRERLSSTGYGGTRPLFNWTDTANRWKNRRVEFLLTKP